MNDNSLLLKALHFAADKHRAQRRKDVHASPYINHPICVAEILSSIGEVDDVEILAAAVLHDTVEDTETSLAELSREFGDRVARIVGEVTDDKNLSKADRKRTQIEHAPELSEEAALVKIADKISNVTDVSDNPPSGWDMNRRMEYLDWAEMVVEKCPVVSKPLLTQFELILASGRSAVGMQ